MNLIELQEYLRQEKQICCADLQIRYGMDYKTAAKTIAVLLELSWICPIESGVYHTVQCEHLHLRTFEKEELKEIAAKLRPAHVRVLRRLSCFSPTKLHSIRYYDSDGHSLEDCLGHLEKLMLVHSSAQGYYCRMTNDDSLELYRLIRMGTGGRDDDDD